MSNLSRRQMVGSLIVGGAAATLAGVGSVQAQAAKPTMKQYTNKDFYGADGKFNAAAAKEAYFELMRFHNYPIVERLKTDEFWVLDFALGNFLEAGMAGIFWVNNKEHNYFGHEIMLLPGQAIPEHKHVKTDVPCKMEGWQPRHGMIYIFGEGEATAGVEKLLPPMHRDIAKARKQGILMPGQVAGLAKPEEWHFMKAGPEGAIVTEYATYHDGAGLRFTHPNVKL